jgi:pyridinium-3,5-biscarboxylic acid mononucleotide synthase
MKSIMNLQSKLLEFQKGMCSIEEITAVIQQEIHLPFATIDIGRKERTGHNECIWGQNKSAEELTCIISEVLKITKDDSILITRLSREKYLQIGTITSSHPSFQFSYYEKSRCLHIERISSVNKKKEQRESNTSVAPVGILVAGTSDLYVAEEAQITLQHCDIECEIYVDIGVAGLHRLLRRLPEIQQHSVLIVVAGMEAALPSVVAGLVSSAIISVPTSVGYGSHLEGITALLGMLNTCSPGISVVNIDNGYGAAMTVSKIVKRFSSS